MQQIRKIDSTSPLAVICAELDNQLAELGEADTAEYLAQLGLSRPLSEHMVEKCYKALDLISFFTMKGTETRAWSIPKGTHASVAAGKIHTDMERGFIKADVINFGELEKIGSYATGQGAWQNQVRRQGL